MMMLLRWAVREHFVSGAYLWKNLSDCLQIEKFQVDKIQNGRPSAIIHLDRPDIAVYHENRSR